MIFLETPQYLTEEQKMVQDMVRSFAMEKVLPKAAEIDHNHEYPAEIIAELGELGMMGVYIPEEYGGGGMDVVSYAIVVEELSRACASTGVIVSAHTSLCVDPIYKFGTEEQKKKYLPGLASGKKLGAFGLTEPDAGSDAAGQKTTAVLEGDEWVLNGSKIFITNGDRADVVVVMAMTDKSLAHKGISAFVVEKGTPGFSVGKLEEKMGIRGSGTAELIFTNCRIPAGNILGKPGDGFKVAMQTLDGGRIGIAAQALGILRACLEDSITYSKERVQFGKPIARNQAIQWMLADMVTDYEAAKLLIWQSATMKDQKLPRYGHFSAMAKLFASEKAMFHAVKAVQIYGGYGFTTEYPVERHMRDAKITEIYEGTSEVQRIVISAALMK